MGRDGRKPDTSSDRGTRTRGYYGPIPYRGLFDGPRAEHSQRRRGRHDDPGLSRYLERKHPLTTCLPALVLIPLSID